MYTFTKPWSDGTTGLTLSPLELLEKLILSKEREQYSQTLAFAFVLRKYPQVAVATHAIAREMIASTAHELDAFMSEHGVFAPAVDTCLANCIAALP